MRAPILAAFFVSIAIAAIAGPNRFTPIPHSALLLRHAVVADPVVRGTVYVAGDGVIHKTTDDGVSWSELHVGSEYLVVAIAVTRTGQILALGWSRGADEYLLTSANGGLTWSRRKIDLPSDITLVMDLVVDPYDARIAYVSTQRLGHDYTEQGPVFMTSNGGATWVQTASFGIPFRPRLGAASLEHHPLLSGVVYAEGDILPGVWITTTGGNAWRPLSGAFRNISVGTGHTLYGATLWATSRPATAFKSEDDGESWSELALPSGAAEYVTIAAAPSVDGVVVIGVLSVGRTGLGTFRSVDGGATWTDISSADDRAGAPFRLIARRVVVTPSGSVFATHSECSTLDACGTYVYTPVGPRRRSVSR